MIRNDGNYFWIEAPRRLDLAALDSEVKQLDASLIRVDPNPKLALSEIRWLRMVKVEYHEATNTLWIAMPNAEVEAQLDEQHERIPGTLRWKIRQKTLLQKAVSLGAAVVSGKASADVIATRRLSCFGNGKDLPLCPAMRRERDGSYCAPCGCGKHKWTKLDGGPFPKLEWAKLDCPLKKPGFSNS